MLVSTDKTETAASGTGAPLGSATKPTMEADRTWANPALVGHKSQTSTTRRQEFARNMELLLFFPAGISISGPGFDGFYHSLPLPDPPKWMLAEEEYTDH